MAAESDAQKRGACGKDSEGERERVCWKERGLKRGRRARNRRRSERARQPWMRCERKRELVGESSEIDGTTENKSGRSE